MHDGPLVMPMSGPVPPSKSSASSPATSPEFPPPLSRFMPSSLITSFDKLDCIDVIWLPDWRKRSMKPRPPLKQSKKSLQKSRTASNTPRNCLKQSTVYFWRHNHLGLPTPPSKRQRIPIRGHRWKMMLPLGSCCLY